MGTIVNEHEVKNKPEMARMLIKAGLGIFPVNQDKKPLIKAWQKQYSTDLQQIRRWYDKKNPPEIAAVTGVSGFFCLDVDGDAGKASLARLEERYGLLPKKCMVETPSGGWHIFFKMPDFDLRNSVGKLGSSLDIRANGGYVVVPPSLAANRNGELRPYRYLTEVALYSGELPEAPVWLLDLLKASTAAKPAKASTAGSGTPYGQKALEDECARVRQAVQGTRNDTLNRAAFAILQLVAGGELDRSYAESALTTAALSIGLGEKEIKATLKSAQVKALSQPRSAPQTSESVGGYGPEKRRISLIPEPPLHVFPPKIQKMLPEAACAFNNLPVDVPIMALLSLLAACVGRSRVVEVKENWEESGNLYLGLVADSGLGKSPCYKEFLKPLWKEEERSKAKWDREMLAYNEAIEERRQCKDRSELGPPPVKPVRTQYIIDDTTTEAIGSILSENPRGLLWYCDELSSIILNLDRYSNSKGGTKARLLSTYDGSPWKTSRRDNERDQVIPSAVLSITGTIQPKILKELFGRHDARSGFLPRFIFILTRRSSPAFLSDSIFTGQEILEKITRHLLSWNLSKHGDKLVPKTIRLSAEAYELYKNWHNQVMDEAWRESEIDSTIAAKLVTQGIRLALLLHCLKAALTESDGLNDIEAETMNEAISLGWWIQAHQRQIWLALDIEDEPDSTPLEVAIIKASLELEPYLEGNDWRVPNVRFNDMVTAHFGQKIDLAQIGKAASRLGIKSIPMDKGRGKGFSRELLKNFKQRFFLSTRR